MTHHDIQQNTDEWLQLRVGKFTASTFKDLMGKETTQAYTNAIYSVVYERLTNEAPENFTNEWMERGRELEPQARLWYELNHSEVQNGGFFCGEWIGASPDGLVGKDGLIEIKCPKYTTQIQYLIDKKLPSNYRWQVQGQLYVTDKKWCEFVSYHPKLPAFIIRVKRDEEAISKLILAINNGVLKAKQVLSQITMER